ncbi:MAG TPA: hypothetical protein VLG36_04930 [Candidatus Chromulinivoraceae bacterium]|nr:hypothetical protein [Candidatus Chromulinivoraceae bacterium]
MGKEFKEKSRYWIDYPEVHMHARLLFDSIQQETPGGAILVAVGRGGWIPTRLVGASFEEASLPFASFSISATYQDLGTPNEYVDIVQGLDGKSINSIKQLLNQGLSLWIIDGPYHTGRAVATVQKYLATRLKSMHLTSKIHIGVLEWMRYPTPKDCPWRIASVIKPDGFGVRINFDEKPYVEYPWEYSAISEFHRNNEGLL